MTAWFLPLAIAGFGVLMVAFAVVWAFETRLKLVMTPLVVIAVYFAIRIVPAMIYAGTESGLGNALPFVIALCAGLAFAIGYGIVNFVISDGEPIAMPRLRALAAPDSVILLTIIGLMLLISALGFYLFRGVPSGTVAVISLVLGDDFGSVAAMMADSRAAITKGHYFGGADRGQGLIRELIAYAWPFAVLISAYCYSLTRKRMYLVLVVIGFFASFVFIAGDGTRAPFLNTIIIYAIGASLLRPLRIRHAVVVVGAVIGLAIAISAYSQKGHGFVEAESPVAAALESIGTRILLGNAINDARAIDLIDRDIVAHRNGALHLRDFQASIPGVAAARPFSYELYQLVMQGRGTTYLTGTYLTKPYVDFGIVGVVVAYLVIGFAACAAFRLLLRLPSNPVTLAIISVAVHALAQMVLGRGVITLGPSAIVLALCLALFSLAWIASWSMVTAFRGTAHAGRIELESNLTGSLSK